MLLLFYYNNSEMAQPDEIAMAFGKVGLIFAAFSAILLVIGIMNIQQIDDCSSDESIYKIQYTICNGLCLETSKLLQNCNIVADSVIKCGNYCTFTNFTHLANTIENPNHTSGVVEIVFGSILLLFTCCSFCGFLSYN